MIGLLVWLLFVAAVFALVYWGLGQLPMPPIFRTVLLVIMGLIGLIILGRVLMGLVGAPPGITM